MPFIAPSVACAIFWICFFISLMFANLKTILRSKKNFFSIEKNCVYIKVFYVLDRRTRNLINIFRETFPRTEINSRERRHFIACFLRLNLYAARRVEKDDITARILRPTAAGWGPSIPSLTMLSIIREYCRPYADVGTLMTTTTTITTAI